MTGPARASAGSEPLPVRKATAADVPSIQDVITAAYARYLPRMDRPPAPLLYDYAAAGRILAVALASVRG